MPCTYINIHTHHLTADPDEIAIVNHSLDGGFEDSAKKVYWSAGLHPWFLNERNDEKNWEVICDWAASNKIIAIGECGLDRLKGPEPAIQEKVFLKHVQLSVQSGLPLIIHCVKAFDILLRIRKEFPRTPSWVLHGFNGKESLAEQLLEKDIKLSFGADLLEEKNHRLRETVKNANLSQVFLETDDRAMPVSVIYHKVADIRDIYVEELAVQIQDNFRQCFKKK